MTFEKKKFKEILEILINHLVAMIRVLMTAMSLSTTLAFSVSVPAM